MRAIRAWRTTIIKRATAASLLMSAGLMGSAVAAAPAMAHDLITNSNPSNGTEIEKLPDKIVMEFSGEPKDTFNTVAVSKDGEVLFTAEPTVDRRELTVDVPKDIESEPGDYTIGYQITSSDGHATRGQLEFSIAGDSASAGDSAASDNAEGEQGESASSVPTWLLPLAGIVCIVGALAVAIMRFRTLGSSHED